PPAQLACPTSSALRLPVRCLLLVSFVLTSPPEISTLSLHDALPISAVRSRKRTRHSVRRDSAVRRTGTTPGRRDFLDRRIGGRQDRKSTRLNSSHVSISYAVFCLKKKRNRTA